MGQYYKPIILAENKKTVLKWMYSHDYRNGLKLMEHSYINNDFVKIFEGLIKNNPLRIVWAGDYAEKCKSRKTNLYSRCLDNTKVNPTEQYSNAETRYIVNHTKKEFVDKYLVPKENDDCKIHPLPLLTCEGNGQGGGDFRGNNRYVGTWARDIISVESRKPKGYNEIAPNFSE